MLTQVLEAARLAPSACNSQPYHFYVAVDGTARAVGAATQSLGMNKFAGDCPAFIVVAEQPYNRSAAVGAKLKDQDYRAADIGLAVSQLVYRAQELGLSTCILGWFDEKTLQALLSSPSAMPARTMRCAPKNANPWKNLSPGCDGSFREEKEDTHGEALHRVRSMQGLTGRACMEPLPRIRPGGVRFA